MKYALLSEAEQRLTKLNSSIKRAAREYDVHCNFSADANNLVDGMKEDGYFKAAPSELFKDYKQRMSRFFEALQNYKAEWRFNNQRTSSDWNDFPIVSGYGASCILKPDKFWGFSSYGFQNFYDFIGSIGAIFENCDDERFRTSEGYTWISENENRRFENIVSADMNGDFRLVKTDITPYETIDPAGSSVSYRPVKMRVVSGYHSTEPAFLVSLMRFAEQEGIQTVLSDEADSFLAEFEQQRIGPFGDFGGSGNSRLCLMNVAWPVPEIGQRTVHRIGTLSEGSYGIYVDDSKNLAIRYESNDGNSTEEPIIFQQSDINHLVRGLFQQASMGLGRTSVAQLVDIVKRRKSPDVEKYIDEVKTYKITP